MMPHARKRILLTRPAGQAQALCQRLQEMGIDAIAVPTVTIHPPRCFDALDDALVGLDRYNWVIFTSLNGVRAFFGRRAVLGRAGRVPASTRWAAIGPATAAELAAHGITAVWMPTRYLSAVLAEELPDVAGRRILRVRADIASPVLADRLRGRGGVVDEVVAYRTLDAPPETRSLLAQELARGVDAVIFTSASTVRGFARLLGPTDVAQHLRGLELIAIGPVTAEAIEAMGWHVDRVADEHSADGIVRLFQERE